MLRLLHVHSGNLFGGVERVLLSLLSDEARESGLRHEFAVCFAGPFEAQAAGRAPIRHLGAVRTSRPWSIPSARRRLRRILQGDAFDAVLVHSAWSMAMFGREIQRAGLPLVYWVHDALDGRHWLQRWARRTRPDLLLCSSRYVGGTLRLVYPDVPFELVHYPLKYDPDIDPGTRAAVRSDLGIAPETVVVAQVGRMEPYKGHALLLEALGAIHSTPGWVNLQVGGAQRPSEAEYVESLKDLARASGIEDRVVFLGQRDDVSRILAASDIFCQPNAGPEPFGLTFIEAMHAGLPVVTTDFGGGAEAVGDCGVLVEPGNSEELAATLRRLIQDPGLRKEFGPCGRARARELTDPRRQSERLRDVLLESLKALNHA